MIGMLDKPGRDKLARQRWSTNDVETRHALAYWVDTICQSFLEIDIDSPARERFRAKLDQCELGPATLYIVEADSQVVRRTPQRISGSRYAGYFVLQLRQGQQRLTQFGREAVISAGDCVVVDCTAPYKLECMPTTRSVALRVPQQWLKNWVPEPEAIVARPFKYGTGWSTPLSSALACLDTNEDELALPEGVVAEQIAALLALAAGPQVQASSGTDKLLLRIRSSIRERCNEPGLTPTAVADMNGISKRYLHHLFAQTGTTFGNELMRMRLDAAKRMLADQRYSALAVSEIAARCGFLEPSHFARRFRKGFGVGPSEFRLSLKS
jgi:AraC-like DNA-binding protein